MHTTSGFQALLQWRLGLLGISLALALALALVVLVVATGLLQALPEPIIVAPVRWG